MRTVLLLPLLSACSLMKLSSLERSFPELDGEVVVTDLAADLRGPGGSLVITRDPHGVPHVRAADEADAWYGLGFVHGQDRLFQADLYRHLAFGRVASWLGDSAIPLDHFVKGLRLHERAEAEVARLPAADREMLESYAAGLNAGAASLRHMPIEYRVAGLDFDPWTPADCLAVTYLQSWNLSENPSHEAAALMLADLEPQVVDDLLRTWPEGPAIDAYWEELREADIGPFTAEFDAFTSALGGLPDASQASNNWVVGPERSASGAPIVANDPHLGQTVPSLWYVADVQGGELHVAGATLPGIPGMPIGHSERLAWGLTNVMADVIDLVVLERSGETGYVLDGEVLELQQRPVHSDRREGPHASGAQWWTRVGPVITELEGTHLVALRWATLEIEDELPHVLRTLATADTVQQALDRAARSPLMVAQNVAIADVDGDWGWQVVGSVPRRIGHTGRVPYPGSEAGQGWDGWIRDLPGERRPGRGYVVTANSRPHHPEADALSTSYVPDHRFSRISFLLDTQEQTPEDQHEIQLDQLEVTAMRHLPALLDGVEASPGGQTCLQILKDWDFVASPESAGAAVWALFHRELVHHAIEDQVGARGARIYEQVGGSGRSLLEAGTLPAFLEDRPRSVQYALERACTILTSTQGEDPTLWTWGALHPLQLTHAFGSRRPKLLKRWNMRPVPFGGSGATVAAAGYAWADGDALPVTGMASLRIVMPLDDLGASTLVHPGGQSGMPDHPQFTSHYIAFVAGHTLPLWFDDDDVAEHAASTLEVR